MKYLLSLIMFVSLNVFAEDSVKVDVTLDVHAPNGVTVIAINNNDFEVTCKYAVSWRLDIINYRRFFGELTLRPDEAFAKSFGDDQWGQISGAKAVFKCHK